MIVAIHQPEHMPYLGFFHKMSRCDAFVILDDVQFTKNNFQNRNRIVQPDGRETWLTVPVAMKGHTESEIRRIRIADEPQWRKKYWRTLAQSYSKHPYFAPLREELEPILLGDQELLIELNMELIRFFRRWLEIDCPLRFSSALGVESRKTDRIVEICRRLGATTYISGTGARDYLDHAPFREAGIELRYQQFSHPEYPAPVFRPYLSTLDLLANCGKEAARYIKGA